MKKIIKLSISLLFIVSLASCSRFYKTEEDPNVYFRSLETLGHMSYYGLNSRLAVHEKYPALKLSVNELKVSELGKLCRDCASVVFDDVLFKNGSIEVELAGAKSVQTSNIPGGGTGMVGIIFRARGHKDQEAKTIYDEEDLDEQRTLADVVKTAVFEGVYIRTEYGVSANHADKKKVVQYMSFPDYPADKLNKEAPYQYTASAKVHPVKWQKLKIDVQGATAKVYVNGSAQPALVVNDLKLGSDGIGKVGLLTEPNTDAYFRNLKITHAE